MDNDRILVTGGSGFIAGHCILELLEKGYTVRATVRSLDREPAVRAVLTDAGLTRGDALEFVAADLMSDAGWPAATAGVDAILHVASPVHIGMVRDEAEVIGPARDGALRVLRAARDGGVRRVVLTSAFHAVGFGHPHDHGEFTETDWSIIDGPGVDAYGKSKILAERAAWDFVNSEGGGLELVTLLPVAVMGPVMGTEISGSNHLIQQMMNGGMPRVPDMYIPIVDVRDVAAAHVAAIGAEGAAGERILLSTGEPAIAMITIAEILRNHLGSAAGETPTRTIPSLVVRLAALFNANYRPAAADLGFVKRVSVAKARQLLGFTPRPARVAIEAAGDSMVSRGLVG